MGFNKFWDAATNQSGPDLTSVDLTFLITCKESGHYPILFLQRRCTKSPTLLIFTNLLTQRVLK